MFYIQKLIGINVLEYGIQFASLQIEIKSCDKSINQMTNSDNIMP